MKPINRKNNHSWLRKLLFQIRCQGVGVVEEVLDASSVENYRDAVANAAQFIEKAVGSETLRVARGVGAGEIRLPMKYDDRFLHLLENNDMLSVIDATLGTTAVVRFMNAEMVVPPLEQRQHRLAATFHMNAPRSIPGYLASIEVLFALTPVEFMMVPGTHQSAERPEADLLEWAAEVVKCPTGGMLVMDSTTWHREVSPLPGSFEIIELQLTRSYIKPHFDYPRALGEERMLSLPERSRQLLGWHTRLPASLEEFYLPGVQRLYQPGQG